MNIAKTYFYRFIFLAISISNLMAQNALSPVARFSFNDRNSKDEISGESAKLRSTIFTRDRFNNEDNAIFLSGNVYSYINLGTNARLKPQTGSISLWVNIENKIFAGKGHTVNPIIVTKNSNNEDFYEAYCIYYSPELGRLYGTTTLDSTAQITISTPETIPLGTWHHFVLAFDDDTLKFYVDAKLQGSMPKKYKSQYLASDSVLLGFTGNKKNERYFQGLIDDIEYYDKVLKPEQVEELYQAPNPNKNKIILKWLAIIFSIILIMIAIFFFVRHRVRLHLKREEKRFEQENLILETELRVNRALMNPHFVFNSLNALQNFILKNENEQANNYLVKFSKLIRKILEVNMTDVITLETEIELLNRYLEIEDLRFEEDIKHIIEVESSMIPSIISIPIMMLQPFVENAIWHGLLKKQGEKQLKISFSIVDAIYLKCVIEDNGIGRKKENQDLFEKKSLATGFVLQRLEILNKLHHLNCSLSIEDKADHKGTIVTILLPILNRLN